MIPLKEDHTVTMHPHLWGRLGDVAEKHYEGSRSKAAEGLILYEWMVEIVKKKEGKPHTHWVSAPFVLHPDEMEPMIARLLAGDADFVGDWLARQVRLAAEALVGDKPAC